MRSNLYMGPGAALESLTRGGAPDKAPNLSAQPKRCREPHAAQINTEDPHRARVSCDIMLYNRCHFGEDCTDVIVATLH